MTGLEWGRVSVTGRDAAKLLQGQLTQDVARATAEAMPLTAWCSPQGRVLALGRLWQSAPERLELLLPAALTAGVARRLALFVLRADARVADEGGGWASTVVTEEAARRRGATPGPDTDAACAAAHCWWIRLAGAPGLLEVVGPATALDALALAAHERVSRCSAGLPLVVEATREAFIPQMLNLDLLGAVNFGKGCYVGQEIVARTQHLGRIKRRMARYLARGDSSTAAGERLRLPGTDPQAEAAAQVVDREGREFLAVVALAHAGTALMDGAGVLLEPATLPYALPELSSAE